MNYTLDSLRQCEKALLEANKNMKIFSVPVIMAGAKLLALKEDPTRAYFGVLTVGNLIFAKLTYRGDQILTVDSASQIIELFTNLDFVDDADVEVAPEGLFRGFEIQIQPNN